MKLNEILAVFNKQRPIRLERLMQLKKYYLSMYRGYMMKLYDASYISDPTWFNEDEIKENIINMEIDRDFINDDSKFKLTYDYVSLAYDVEMDKGNFNVNTFLFYLKEAMYFRNLSSDLDVLYDRLGFGRVNKAGTSPKVVKTSTRLQSKASLVVNNQLPPISTGYLNAFEPQDKMVTEHSVNDVIWDLAMEMLCIPVSERNQDGLFIPELCHENEVKHCKLILNGSVPRLCRGTHITYLSDWLSSNLYNELGMSNTRKGLYDRVFSYSDSMTEYFKSLYHSLIDKGIEVVCICGNKYYTRENVQEYVIPVGCFVSTTIETDDGDIKDILLPQETILDGYTGECKPIELLQNDDILYEGCPIRLGESLYFDIEQVQESSSTWFKESNMEYAFMAKVHAESFKFLFENSNSNDLYKKLVDLYIDSLSGTNLYTTVTSLEDYSKISKAVKRKIKKGAELGFW